MRIIAFAAAYLIGSLPFGFLLVKHVFTRGEDIRTVGSGGTGATNVTRRAGRLAGLLTYALDLAKGIAAVILMSRVAKGDYVWIGAAGIAAVLGHIFPIFLRFRGGKGVSTGMGMYLPLAPYSVVAALAIFILTVGLTRYVSLGSVVAAAALPILSWLFYGVLQRSPHVTELTLIAVAAFALILFAHRGNVMRLIRGTESKLGERASQPQQSPTTGGRA
jgi:glycerol-3-phosphate acyltransferase PlsY